MYLRTLERTDIPTTHRWINDPEISAIMGILPVKPLAQQEQWYDKLIHDPTRYVFAICLRQTEQHIGNAALSRVDHLSRNAMLSIFIYGGEHRGKGYGSQAIRLLLDFAFGRLNMHKVYLRTSPTFVEAIKMYERLGFVKEGVLREQYYANGEYSDKHLYGILAREYRRAQKPA